MSAIGGQSGHEFLRRICPLLTQSGHHSGLLSLGLFGPEGLYERYLRTLTCSCTLCTSHLACNQRADLVAHVLPNDGRKSVMEPRIDPRGGNLIAIVLQPSP